MAGLARLGAVGGQGEAGLGNGVLRKPLRSTAPLVNIAPRLTFLEILCCL